MFRYARGEAWRLVRALRYERGSPVTELSFRGYDVVAVSAYIASERDPHPHPSPLPPPPCRLSPRKEWILRAWKRTTRYERTVRGSERVYPQSSVSGQIKHEAARSFRLVECFLPRKIQRHELEPSARLSTLCGMRVQFCITRLERKYVPQDRKY